MMEVDVATRRKPAVVGEDPPANYLVLGDFGARAIAPVAIDRDNFDDALQRMGVRVGEIQFHQLDDFHPDRLCQRVPLFRDIIPPHAAEKQKAGDDRPPQPDLEKLLRPSGLLEQIVEGGDPLQEYVRELVRTHAAPKQHDDPARDAALGERMRGVLHHSQFQAVESTWRGLDFLIRHADLDGPGTDTNGGARIFIAQYSREDANRDLPAATTLRETRLWELLNARKWRAIAGLYSFGPDASDIELLARIALLAAHVRAPFLAEGSADMGPHWHELTAIPEAGHLGLVLPRFLLRLPYGARTTPIDSFEFEEMPGVPVHGRYLWGNPALACLTLLVRGGGSLDLPGLPLHTYRKDGEWTMTPCAEVLMTEVQELALIEMGLMPLVSSATSDCARLAGFRAIDGEALPL